MLFTNGHVFDGQQKCPPGTAVLLGEDRILSVGPEAEFDGYAGHVHDMAGGTVLPGLMDCHVHLTMSGDGKAVSGQQADLGELTLTALENAQKALRSGITALRDCGGVEFVEFAVRDACNSGRFPGPVIRASGKVICMTGGTKWQVGRVADGPQEVVKAVREQIYRGCDCVKMMATGAVLHPGSDLEDAQYTEAELAAGVAEAKRFRKPSAAHAIGTQGILNAVRAGVTSIEHGMIMTPEIVEEMVRRGTYLVPTLAAVAQVLAHPDSVPARAIERAERVAERHRQSVAMFHAAGGRIAMGADTGTLMNPHGDNARELWHMVDCGMSPADALAAATSVAAGLLGLPDRGRIAPDHVADLLVVDGDPTQNILIAADRTHHRQVIKSGRVVAGRGATHPV